MLLIDKIAELWKMHDSLVDLSPDLHATDVTVFSTHARKCQELFDEACEVPRKQYAEDAISLQAFCKEITHIAVSTRYARKCYEDIISGRE